MSEKQFHLGKNGQSSVVCQVARLKIKEIFFKKFYEFINRKQCNNLWIAKDHEYRGTFKGVLHPRPVFGLFLYFSQKLQHIGNK